MYFRVTSAVHLFSNWIIFTNLWSNVFVLFFSTYIASNLQFQKLQQELILGYLDATSFFFFLFAVFMKIMYLEVWFFEHFHVLWAGILCLYFLCNVIQTICRYAFDATAVHIIYRYLFDNVWNRITSFISTNYRWLTIILPNTFNSKSKRTIKSTNSIFYTTNMLQCTFDVSILLQSRYIYELQRENRRTNWNQNYFSSML